MKTVEVLSINSTFLTEVENMCRVNGVDTIDAVITWCEKNGVEVETVASIIKRDSSIRARIQAEAEACHAIKRTGARLPV